MTTLVLASASPRRRELLLGLGLHFEIRPAEIDETHRNQEPAATYVERLARAKATECCLSDEIVLAADTVVVLGEEILGKPRNDDDAQEILAKLAGQEHTVLTGVAIALELEGQIEVRAAVCSTRVRISEMTPEMISWYVGTGEPADKAGAYAIQGLGAVLVDSIEGNYTNVVGFPLPLVRELTRALGIELLAFRERGPLSR